MQNDNNLDKQGIVDNIETKPQSKDSHLASGFVDDTSEEDQVEEFTDDDDPTCGWGSWRPKWAQVLNSPKGFCLFLCLFALAQSMTVSGLVYVDTTTLEKRFDLPSVQSGSISSFYDFTVTIVVIFVTYFGEKQHKPKLLGIGAIIFGIGCYTFSLPHFTTGYYHNREENGVSVDNISTCDANRSIPLCIDEDGGRRTSLSSYYWVFMFAQLLNGIGAAPLYTLGIIYLDDNVTPKLVAMYLGLFNATAVLGPALGYVLGGVYLTIYTDVRIDPIDHGISRESPIWVGAWWIGFLVSGSCCLLVSIPLLGYPKALPGAKLVAKERALKKNNDDDDDGMVIRASYDVSNIKNFPAAVWNLVKNIPYMMLNLSTCSEWFILAVLAVFGPKYMESQLNISPSLAAEICGFVVILAGIGGILLGGWVVKRFQLSVRGMLQFILATRSVSTLLLSCFFIYCDNVKFAGVTTHYSDKSLSYSKGMPSNTIAPCNVDCRCAQTYDPVCGVDDVIYYNGCHAGCAYSIENSEGILEYFDCACMNVTVDTNEPMGTAVRCGIDCPLIPLFLVLLFCQLIFTFMAIVPSLTALLRIVDHEQRAFGLGIQSVMYRLLGNVPGPIIFGAIIDGQCLLWEKECDGSNGTCWLYDNKTFSQYKLLMTGTLKIFSLVTVAGSILTLGSRGTESSAKSSGVNQDLHDGGQCERS